jgi:hypothetical protein
MVAENKCGGGGAAKENYEITEINARFSFNGLLHQAHGQEALELMGVCNNGLVAGTSTEEVRY